MHKRRVFVGILLINRKRRMFTKKSVSCVRVSNVKVSEQTFSRKNDNFISPEINIVADCVVCI